jgi:hypothetical protein
VASSVLPYHDSYHPTFPYPGVGSVYPTTPRPDSRREHTPVVVVGGSWLHHFEQRRRLNRLDYRRRRRFRWTNRRDEVVVYTGTANATFPRCCTFGALLGFMQGYLPAPAETLVTPAHTRPASISCDSAVGEFISSESVPSVHTNLPVG